MRSAVLALLAVTACDKLFEIKSYTQDDAAPIVDTELVSGTYKLRFTVNAADFTPMVVEEAYAASQLTMTVQLDDGTTPPVSVNDDGTFSFPRATATQAYALTITSPVATAEYDLAASQLVLVERSFGRPEPNPVTSPTVIHFDLGPGPVPGSVVIASTGMWTFTGPPGIANTGVFDFDWSTATPVSSQLGLLRADLDDRLYFIDMGSYTNYSAIYAYSAFSLTQTNLMPATISGAPPALVTHNLCTHVVALRAEAVNRLHTALPDYTTASYDDWFLFLTPATSLGPGAGTWVAGDGEPVANTPTDAVVDAAYMNPFPGTTAIGSMAAVTYRNVQLGTATPLAIASGGRMWQPITPGTTCAASGVVLQTAVAIASTPTLAGVLLDTDNQVVTLDLSQPVPVTWGEAASGGVDHVTLQLIEVTNDAGLTATHLRHRIITLATSGTLDPSLFVVGHTYLIGIVNVTEFPNAATGDFDTIAYPVANSTTLSHSFVVGS